MNELLAAAQVLPEVGFWILDTRGRRVALFDSAGHHVRSIDSQGDGPGEFQFPVAFAVSDGDDLFVLDAQLSRLSQFRTSAGEHEFIGGYRVNQRFRSVCLLNGDLWFGGLLGNKLAHQVDEYGAVAASVGSPPTIPGMEMLGNFGETLAYPQLVRPRIFCDEENG